MKWFGVECWGEMLGEMGGFGLFYFLSDLFVEFRGDDLFVGVF